VYTVLRKQQTQRTVNIDSVGMGDMVQEMEEDQYAEWMPVLSAAVADLEEDDLQMIEMRFFEKRPFKEIADILEMTENNAKVKTYRILEKLKKILIEKKKNRA
jgi:RNA polymerase sigma-70 factor (ECF subfamily)